MLTIAFYRLKDGVRGIIKNMLTKLLTFAKLTLYWTLIIEITQKKLIKNQQCTMKKLILLFALGMFVVSCSKDTATEEQIENNALLESVDPDSATPKAALDGSSLGMYHGFIATLDSQFNAKIWINAGNDGKFNATAKSITHEKFSFFSHEADMTGTLFVFKGAIGTFTLDVSDPANAVISNVTINGTEGVSRVYKEFSYQRGVVSLGSYVDSSDAGFSGVWNLLSDGTPHPAGAGVAVNEVDVITAVGGLFTDLTMETADFACFGQVAMPPMLWLVPGVNNEIWVFQQTSNWGGFDATYDLGVSALVRDGNNLGYDSVINRAGDGTPGCFLALAQGTWAWNGRTGTVSFPGDVPLPVLSCGDVTADTGGEIVDYRNDEFVTRVVTTGDGSPMTLYFTSFETESCCDFLTIYDGADNTAAVIGTYSGSDLAFVQIDGTTDSLTLEFDSDGSVTDPGWAALVCGTAPPPLVCDEDYVDTGGTAGAYSSNELIATTYSAPGLGEVVLATFQVFDIEGGWDFMRVHDGATTAATEIIDINGQLTSTNGTTGNNGFTGTQLTGQSFQSSGADLTFEFQSDSSVTDVGWEICIQYVTPATVAPKNMVKDTSRATPWIQKEVTPMSLNR